MFDEFRKDLYEGVYGIMYHKVNGFPEYFLLTPRVVLPLDPETAWHMLFTDEGQANWRSRWWPVVNGEHIPMIIIGRDTFHQLKVKFQRQIAFEADQARRGPMARFFARLLLEAA